jgi:hypothetical protein
MWCSLLPPELFAGRLVRALQRYIDHMVQNFGWQCQRRKVMHLSRSLVATGSPFWFFRPVLDCCTGWNFVYDWHQHTATASECRILITSLPCSALLYTPSLLQCSNIVLIDAICFIDRRALFPLFLSEALSASLDRPCLFAAQKVWGCGSSSGTRVVNLQLLGGK